MTSSEYLYGLAVSDFRRRLDEHAGQPRPYQDQLPQGATVVAWTERWLVWRPAHPTFGPSRPFVVHPVSGGRIAGSGVYDLDAGAVFTVTGIRP